MLLVLVLVVVGLRFLLGRTVEDGGATAIAMILALLCSFRPGVEIEGDPNRWLP